MKRTEFIESLKGELIRRGFDEKSAEAEMAPFIGYFEENGIEDVKVSVSDMVKEIMDMRGSAAAAEEPDAGSVRSATDVSAASQRRRKPARIAPIASWRRRTSRCVKRTAGKPANSLYFTLLANKYASMENFLKFPLDFYLLF